MHFEVRDDAQLRRHDLSATLPDDDLCLRAARLLQRRSGTHRGADISIDKQVPWGAGLGGGSSDAASVLLALNRLWGLGWPLHRLIEIGLELGADVPFFLGGRNAFVEGIGERLTPLDVPPQWLAVLKPAAAIETRSIFTSPLLVRDTQAVILESFLVDARNLQSRQRDKQALREPGRDGLTEGACEDWLGDFGRNDLQAAASALCAEVVQAAELLQAQFGNSRMTGSGSAVFARAGTQAQPSAVHAGAHGAGLGGANVPQPGDPPFVRVGFRLTEFWVRGCKTADLCRGVAKLVKASDFDSDMRGFESFLPCQDI